MNRSISNGHSKLNTSMTSKKLSKNSGTHVFEFTIILSEREIECVMMCDYNNFLRIYNALQTLASKRELLFDMVNREDVPSKVTIFKI